MSVVHDAAVESHTGTTGSTNEASYTWQHVPVGTPKGILVFTMTNLSSTEHALSVTYGGVNVPEVTGGRAVDTVAGETGSCKAWFLGSGIPTGNQNVVVTRTNDAIVMYGVSISVTAAANTKISGTPVLLQEDGIFTEQNVDSGSDVALRYAAYFSGRLSVLAAGANSTLLQSIDYGAYVNGSCRETTEGSGSRPVGFNENSTDDRAGVHLAIAEVSYSPDTLLSPGVMELVESSGMVGVMVR